VTGCAFGRNGMSFDVIVIGAGLGGLGCAARLAGQGLRVLVLEKNNHIGGTSYVFRRAGYTFPMGPLSFSFPDRVRSFLQAAGVEAEVNFRRNHFQLLSPGLDIVYSQPLESLRQELSRTFPAEARGLEAFFGDLTGIIRRIKDIELWHPDYLPHAARTYPDSGQPGLKSAVTLVRELSLTPCRRLLDRHLSHPTIISFLGSQGTSEPEMSLLTLAFMWNAMSEVGIWSPSCGIHGLSDLLAEAVKRKGGEIRLQNGVTNIQLEKGRVIGVLTESGEDFSAPWVVSNVDPKKTFLELCRPADLPPEYLAMIDRTPYTESELCVYLGVDPGKVDWRRMRATHLFFRHKEDAPKNTTDALEDFETREIEICRWSDNASDHVPQGKSSLVLRVGFPYGRFEEYRTGDRKRTPEYKTGKLALTRRLIAAAEKALPGLGAAVEVVEAATPLTYADWGRRFQGSIAGWSWSVEYGQAFGSKLLTETPVENLLLAGIYAATELFLGGVPTALHTADLAARIILGETFQPQYGQ
jgi:phytoene dehydrogenase-like protein